MSGYAATESERLAAAKNLPLLQAWAEGEVLQYFHPGTSTWIDCDPPGIKESFYRYRVKPVPQYRPFTPEEALKHVRRTICPKADGDGDRSFRVWAVNEYGLCDRDGSCCNYKFALEGWTFDDGSPCGVIVEDS